MTRTGLWGSLAAGLSCVALVAAPSALAQTPFVNEGAPGGPLTQVAIGNDLSCQVQHTGDTAFELFPSSTTPGDSGTFLATGGALYTPDFSNHGGGSTATGSLGARTPYTPVSQTPVSGSGSGASPLRVTTIVNVASTGLQITEIDSYVAGQESYRTDVDVKNTGGANQSVVLYRAGDCFLQNPDSGFGFVDPATKSVGCSANANNSPPNRIEEWVPITGGNNYTQDTFSAVWSKIAAKTPFADDCVHCGDQVDNGAGISWAFDVGAGPTVRRWHYTTFSPSGVAGPPPNTTPTEPAVTGPRATPLGLPTRRGWGPRRKIRLKLHHGP